MTVEQLFSMSAEEVRDSFQEAVSTIRENRSRKGGLPYTGFDHNFCG